MPSKQSSSSSMAFTPSLPLKSHSKPSNAKRSSRKPPTAQITTVSDRQLIDLLKSEDNSSVVVLKCFASYCRGCKGVEPKFRKIAAAYEQANAPERPSVHFCQMDYARHEQFCQDTLGVHSLPFFGIWKDGRYIGGEAMGWQHVSKRLVEKIDGLVNPTSKAAPSASGTN